MDIYQHAEQSRSRGLHDHTCKDWILGRYASRFGDWETPVPDRIRQITGRTHITIRIGDAVLVGPPVQANRPDRVWVYYPSAETAIATIVNDVDYINPA